MPWNSGACYPFSSIPLPGDTWWDLPVESPVWRLLCGLVPHYLSPPETLVSVVWTKEARSGCVSSSKEVKQALGPAARSHSWLLIECCCCCCRVSRVRLCATPETAAHQALPSLGFSRQEHWSGLPCPSPMLESEKWKWSCSVMSHSSWPHGLQPTRLLHPWDSPGKSTGVGCHRLLHLIA